LLLCAFPSSLFHLPCHSFSGDKFCLPYAACVPGLIDRVRSGGIAYDGLPRLAARTCGNYRAIARRRKEMVWRMPAGVDEYPVVVDNFSVM
jgi:hypothetical protein